MPFIEISVVVVLILINAALAGSELAIVSSRKVRLERMAEEGSRGARIALYLLRDPSGFLATVQIGITLIGLVAGAYSGATLANALGDWLDGFAWIAPNGDAVAIALVVIPITYLSLIVGELVPKRVALTNPERVAAIVALPMLVLSRIASPAVWLLRNSTELVLRVLGLSAPRDSVVTEDEILSLIAEGTRVGVFRPEERDMIEGVLRLADRSIRTIMTPRGEVSWLPLDATYDEVTLRLRKERHVRLLVCDGSIDHPVGVVDATDIMEAAGGGGDFRLADVTRKMLIVPEQTRILDLIETFRREGRHFAVIVDEYGTTQGVVTATDILESIAGDLPHWAEPAEKRIVTRADGSWLIDGRLPIDEFADLVGQRKLDGEGRFETLAGLVIDRLGRLPEAGDRTVLGNLSIEVVDMDGRRIDKLLVTRIPAQERESDV